MTDDHALAVRNHAAERYLLGEMSEADREAYEAHFFSCPDCAEDVRTTAAFLDEARTYIAPAVPAPSISKEVRGDSPKRPRTAVFTRVAARRAAWYRSPAIPWALAASLVVFTAYQSLVLVPGLRSQLTPHGLHPITLRPESRGQEQVVQAESASEGFTLAIEVGGVEEGGALEYTIATIGGRQVTSGRAQAPRAGAPLLLWLPASALAEPTRYSLSIHDVAAGRVLDTYRFVRSN